MFVVVVLTGCATRLVMLVVVVLSRACREGLNASSIRDTLEHTQRNIRHTWTIDNCCWLLVLLRLLLMMSLELSTGMNDISTLARTDHLALEL